MSEEIQQQSIQTYLENHPGFYAIDPNDVEAGYQAWDPNNPDALGDILDVRPKPQKFEEDVPRAETDLAGEAFDSALVTLEVDVPELSDKKEMIAHRGKELIEEFGLSASMFDSPSRTLFFSALAERYEGLEAGRGDMDTAKYSDEKTFIADAVMSLALDRSAYYSEVQSVISSDVASELSQEDEAELYHEFTNTEMSQQLAAAMEGDLLVGIREKLAGLGVDEQPFDVVVLDVGPTTSMYDMRGLEKAGKLGVPDLDTYREQMAAKTQEFCQRLGVPEIQLAWVNQTTNPRRLVVTLPIAQKLLSSPEDLGEEYTEATREGDIAHVEHEYVHTQGGLGMDGEIFLGVALEERRAELLSGDHHSHGYQDVKGFMSNFSIITGIDMEGAIAKFGSQKTPDVFYTKVAAALGMQTTLELALATPKAYIDSTRQLQRDMNKHLGGLDGILRSVYQRFTADPARAEMLSQRIDAMADIRAKSDPARHQEWMNMRRYLGLSFLESVIQERSNEKTTIASRV